MLQEKDLTGTWLPLDCIEAEEIRKELGEILGKSSKEVRDFAVNANVTVQSDDKNMLKLKYSKVGAPDLTFYVRKDIVKYLNSQLLHI